MAEKAASLKTGGVGLLRTNFLIDEELKHPFYYYIKKGKQDELVDLLARGIERVAKAFAPKPVWVRTMDFTTEELALLEEGQYEVHEENPLLGWRGIARTLKQSELLDADLLALKRVVDAGYTNVGVIFPMVRDISEYREAKRRMQKLGLKPHTDIKVSSMFETPSAAVEVDDFIAEGLDLAFIGMNDITMYMLAADRTNPNMWASYDPANPAVLSVVYALLEKCKKAGVETTASFLSALKPVLPVLLEKGLTSVTLQADRINEVGELLVAAEKASGAA
ncbi:hypothetical protein HY090_01495 [Candidatus Kaiserbacteria bacterium]|nr:hypothetical protein [Candidatus Kaiserbacteria bacterium]